MDCLAEYEAWLVERDCSDNTIASYLRSLSQFQNWMADEFGAPLEPVELTMTAGRLYRKHLRGQHLAPATINAKLAALRSYSRWCVLSGKLDANPLADLADIDTLPLAPKWLSPRDQGRFERELERAINAAPANTPTRKEAIRDRAAFLLMLNAGLRVGEVAALDVDDVQVGERSGWVVIRDGKGGNAGRLPLNKIARAALKRWLRVRPDCPTRALFVGRRRVRLETRGMERRMGEIARRAGVEATPHTLRHTMAKRLLDAKRPITEVAAILRHKRLDTTARYTLPGMEDLTAAVAALE